MIHPLELIHHPLTLLEPSPTLKGPPKTAKPWHGKTEAHRKNYEKLVLDIKTQFCLDVSQ
jgi:hypothetical protein